VIDFTIETHIARPVAEVFAYVTDPSTLSEWQTNTVSVVVEPDGPVAVGSRLREVHRGPGGVRSASVVEVVELDMYKSFRLRMVEGRPLVHADISFVKATVDHMRLAFRVHGQTSGLMRLLEPLLVVGLRRQFTAHCATLKRMLEQG
jgi:uncharacterized protein YndB with AHSA1/START domain